MAHTNSTTNYALPQFLSTDKPAWLTDVNPAYAAIDTGMHNAQVAADAAQGDATQALSDAASADGKATTADTKATGAIASLAEAFDATATYAEGEFVMYNSLLYVCIADVTNPGPWTGSTNWNRTTLDIIATNLISDVDAIDSKTGSDIPVSNNDASTIANTLSISNITPSPVSGVSIIHGAVKKYGKIVIANIFMRVESSIANNGILLTNMPKSAANFRAPKLVGGSMYVNNTFEGSVFMDEDSTDMKIMTAIEGTPSTPLGVQINVTYVTSE